jgi:hypothetical protein
MRRFLMRLAPIILLLCHFALRIHEPDVQQAHLDEGFHLSRALTVWNFEENPGRFAHGKMLLYFWLGLFERADGPGRCTLHSSTIPCAWVHVDPETNVPTPLFPAARMSIAIFSMLTAATIYLLGRWLFHPYVGLLALALYAILPFAFFYERLAFADPLAAGMMTLGIWRSIVFARHPTRTQAVIMGLVLSLAVMAKMTMGLIVLLPLAAIVLERHRVELSTDKPKRGLFAAQIFDRWLIFSLIRRYLLNFILACIVGLAIWLPVLIPAVLAHNTPERFILVNDTNIARDEDFLFKPIDYLTRIGPALLDYWGEGLMIGWVVAFLFGLMWFPFSDHRWSRGFLYIAISMVLAVLPSALIARVQTTRYLMPAAVPIVLIVAAVIVGIMMLPAKARNFSIGLAVLSPVIFLLGGLNLVSGMIFAVALVICGVIYRGWGRWLWRPLGVLSIVGIVIWGFVHARDFASRILTDPHNYPFHAVNRTEFVVAFFLADDGVQKAAQTINDLPDAPLYATWNLCHMMYYYTDRPINCLAYDGPVSQLTELVRQLPPNAYFDLTVTDYKPFWDNIGDAAYEVIATHPRRIIDRPVFVLRIWRKGETPSFEVGE